MLRWSLQVLFLWGTDHVLPDGNGGVGEVQPGQDRVMRLDQILLDSALYAVPLSDAGVWQPVQQVQVHVELETENLSRAEWPGVHVKGPLDGAGSQPLQKKQY